MICDEGTLKWNFRCPFVRELMLALGLVDVSKQTLLKVMDLSSLSHCNSNIWNAALYTLLAAVTSMIAGAIQACKACITQADACLSVQCHLYMHKAMPELTAKSSGRFFRSLEGQWL